MGTIDLQAIYICSIHGEVLAHKVQHVPMLDKDNPVTKVTISVCPACYLKVQQLIEKDGAGNEIPVYGQVIEGPGYWREFIFTTE